MNIWILLSILIPIAVILAITLLMLIFFIHRQRKNKALLENIKQSFSDSRLQTLGVIINRVVVIAESNPKFTNLYHELNIVHSDFMNNILLGQKKIANLSKTLNGLKGIRLSSRNLKKTISDIRNIEASLDRIESQFHNLSDQIIAQDEMIRKEFTFYKSCLRKSQNVYNSKRLLLEQISEPINKLNENLKKLERDFEKIIDKADNTNAAILMRKYMQKVILFIDVVNEGPSISMQLKRQIPEVVNKLSTLYKKMKNGNEFQVPLSHIKFKTSLKNVSKQFQKAVECFNNLEIEQAKKCIKDVLKSFKMIESQINLEVRSRNVFVKIYNPLVILSKNSLKKWLSIKHQFKQLSGSGRYISQETVNKYSLLKQSVKSLDESALTLREYMKNKNLPYSTKLKRAEITADKNAILIKELNAFVQMLWSINLDASLTKQKFSRAESALLEVISNLKTKKIKLSLSERKEQNNLLDIKSNISLLLDKPMDKTAKEKIEGFLRKVIDFYSIASGKLQIAMHLKNIIGAFAAARSNDPKLNLGFKLAEMKYVEGKYAEGLNIAIDAIKEGER